MNPTSIITAVVQAIANVFGWSLQRSQVKNSEKMQARVERQKEVDRTSEIDKAIAKRDLDEIRKGCAE